MRLLDSRRLTGPNLMTPGPAAIAEVSFEEGEEAARAIAAWRSELLRMLDALGEPGLAEAKIFVREFKRGAALVFEAPVDILLPATEINDWAVASATDVVAGRPAASLEPKRTELSAALNNARDPQLVSLREEAHRRGIPFLLDDKAVTLGMGRRSMTWPRGQVPADIPWPELASIPVALITGTNGKTTSTRLVARIARCAGLTAGSTSTDGVALDGKIVEAGDYTGPAGALAVLRRPEVDIAVLETARGGILRRGLAVEAADAALITNVSADHLGDYGIEDLETMARVKAVIAGVARRVVLNAEDPSLVRLASQIRAPIVWFAVDRSALGGRAGWFVDRGSLVRANESGEEAVVRVADIPITFGGRARYNIENALGAAALADLLGLSLAAIREGLTGFRSSAADNPGRGNLAELPSGVRVLVDFGHNPAGVEKVLAFARELAGPGRMMVIAGMPGDRLDEEMLEVAARIARASPRRVFLRELPGYLRGREPGAVPELLRRGLLEAGLPAERVELSRGEVVAVEAAVAAAQPGEVVAILPSLEGAAVRALVEQLGGTWA